MKTIIMFFALSIVLNTNNFGQAQKTLVRTVENIEDLAIHFNKKGSKIIIKQWDRAATRVFTTIAVENADQHMLDHLHQSGRYDYDLKNKDGKIIFDMPNAQQTITLGNTDLKETITYEIYVPYGVLVENGVDTQPMIGTLAKAE
ncbi:MAG: hypothetical protein GY810_06885 [Aureispira sp.]|nr:hypothetical protein [Aureispira sp.]